MLFIVKRLNEESGALAMDQSWHLTSTSVTRKRPRVRLRCLIATRWYWWLVLAWWSFTSAGADPSEGSMGLGADLSRAIDLRHGMYSMSEGDDAIVTPDRKREPLERWSQLSSEESSSDLQPLEPAASQIYRKMQAQTSFYSRMGKTTAGSQTTRAATATPSISNAPTMLHRFPTATRNPRPLPSYKSLSPSRMVFELPPLTSKSTPVDMKTATPLIWATTTSNQHQTPLLQYVKCQKRALSSSSERRTTVHGKRKRQRHRIQTSRPLCPSNAPTRTNRPSGFPTSSPSVTPLPSQSSFPTRTVTPSATWTPTVTPVPAGVSHKNPTFKPSHNQTTFPAKRVPTLSRTPSSKPSPNTKGAISQSSNKPSHNSKLTSKPHRKRPASSPFRKPNALSSWPTTTPSLTRRFSDTPSSLPSLTPSSGNVLTPRPSHKRTHPALKTNKKATGKPIHGSAITTSLSPTLSMTPTFLLVKPSTIPSRRKRVASSLPTIQPSRNATIPTSTPSLSMSPTVSVYVASHQNSSAVRSPVSSDILSPASQTRLSDFPSSSPSLAPSTTAPTTSETILSSNMFSILALLQLDKHPNEIGLTLQRTLINEAPGSNALSFQTVDEVLPGSFQKADAQVIKRFFVPYDHNGLYHFIIKDVVGDGLGRTGYYQIYLGGSPRLADYNGTALTKPPKNKSAVVFYGGGRFTTRTFTFLAFDGKNDTELQGPGVFVNRSLQLVLTFGDTPSDIGWILVQPFTPAGPAKSGSITNSSNIVDFGPAVSYRSNLKFQTLTESIHMRVPNDKKDLYQLICYDAGLGLRGFDTTFALYDARDSGRVLLAQGKVSNGGSQLVNFTLGVQRSLTSDSPSFSPSLTPSLAPKLTQGSDFPSQTPSIRPSAGTGASRIASDTPSLSPSLRPSTNILLPNVTNHNVSASMASSSQPPVSATPMASVTSGTKVSLSFAFFKLASVGWILILYFNELA